MCMWLGMRAIFDKKGEWLEGVHVQNIQTEVYLRRTINVSPPRFRILGPQRRSEGVASLHLRSSSSFAPSF